MGSSVNATPNPLLTGYTLNDMNAANSLLSQGPVTSLPAGYSSNLSYPTAKATLQNTGKAESALPSFLQMNSSNPLYSTGNANGQQSYQNALYDQSLAPQLGANAEQAYLGGNLGNGASSTFGANMLGAQQAAALQDSILNGQQYYTNAVNNNLNERNNYFGTSVANAQNSQNQNLQAQEFNQQNNLNAYGMLNNFNLNAAQTYNQQMSTLGNLNVAQTGQNLDAQKFNAQSRGGLISALTGGIGGLIGGGASLLGGGGGFGSAGLGSGSSGGSFGSVLGGGSALGGNGFFSGATPIVGF